MNSGFTQQYRRIAVENNPLGKDVLLLTGFTGQEALSQPFCFQLELLSKKTDISSKDIVGKKITFRINCSDNEARYFNGYVNKFTASSLTFQDMRLYRADVVPWFWFLTRTADCRIFQNKTVPQIIEEVLTDHGEIKNFELTEVRGTYSKREFCVQYRESDFNFISRLIEEEGIFYWFRHEKDKHVMVMADHIGAYTDLPDKEVEFVSGSGEALDHGQLFKWEHRHEFHPGKWAQTDYNFKTPSTRLLTSSETVIDLPDTKKYEIFDFPGQYLTREEGEQFTKVRMEEIEVSFDQVDVEGTYCSFAPGGKFTLKRHECESEKGKTYLITSIRHEVEEQTYLTGGDAKQYYRNSFTCIPASVIYRPTRRTLKGAVQGLQTAVVVGPSGEEIYTDEYGRVKVQFHWDRYGEFNEHSSCWIRVSQVHAGKGFGAVDIPRIGEEVIVEFLEGDPDRPIITGRIYNENNKPPTDLPKEKMLSGIKSNTTPGGGGNNSILLDDTKEKEKFSIHAQHNMDSTIQDDLSTTVVKGNETHTVSTGTQTITIKGNASITVQEGDRIVNVTGNYKCDTTNQINLQAPSKITLTCGGSVITMEPGRISLQAGGGASLTLDSNATMSSPAEATVEALKSTLTGGGSTTVADAAGVAITGIKISLNG